MLFWGASRGVVPTTQNQGPKSPTSPTRHPETSLAQPHSLSRNLCTRRGFSTPAFRLDARVGGREREPRLAPGGRGRGRGVLARPGCMLAEFALSFAAAVAASILRRPRGARSEGGQRAWEGGRARLGPESLQKAGRLAGQGRLACREAALQAPVGGGAWALWLPLGSGWLGTAGRLRSASPSPGGPVGGSRG